MIAAQEHRWRDLAALLFFSGAVSAFLVVLWIVVSSAVTPFAPYTIVRYNALPKEDCPGALVTVGIDRNLQKPRFGEVTNTDVYSTWRNAVTGTTLATEIFSRGAPKEYGRAVFDSPFKRVAPTEPGLWQLDNKIVVTGRVLGMPRRQVIRDTAQDLYRVLSPSAPECQDE